MAITKHFAYHRRYLIEELFPVWIKQNSSARALVDQIVPLLMSLPENEVPGARKKKRHEPEMVSLLDDDDDDGGDDRVSTTLKDPETITLLDD